MSDELNDIPAIEDLLAESMAELLLRKTHLAYALADIEGQLLVRTGADDEMSGWRRKAKTKAHYLRRSLAAVNNVISIKVEKRKSMWSDDDKGEAVLVALSKLLRVWETALAVIELDEEDEELEEQLWANLSYAVENARETYFQVATDG